ncbi:MAG: transposase, partial [Planctomycetota bacterium]
MKTARGNQQPESVEALKALLADREAALAEREALLAERDAIIAKLEHRIDLLTREAFGPRTERRPTPGNTDHIAQAWLLFPELIELAERVADATQQRGEVEIKQTPNPKKKGGRRKKYPSHLPVIRTTYELPDAKRSCDCGHALHEIGEEVTRELERLELTVVHEIARKKYGCRSCTDGVRTAEGPPRVIDKGQLGVSFLSHVLVERFGNHMPYHRLERKYASEGLDLSRSVLWRSAHRCAEFLEPIHKELERQVLNSDAIHTDDTTVTLKEAKGGGRKTARI